MLVRSGLRLAETLLCRSAAALPSQGLATLSSAARPAVLCTASVLQASLLPPAASSTWSARTPPHTCSPPLSHFPNQRFTTLTVPVRRAEPQPVEQPTEDCPKPTPAGKPVVDTEVLTDPDKTFECGYVAPHKSMAPVEDQMHGARSSDGQMNVNKMKQIPEGMTEQEALKREMDHLLFRPNYTKDYVESVAPKHKQPKQLRERLGLRLCQLMRFAFDKATAYGANMNEKRWLRRIIFLETIAGVPGMMGAMVRHLQSLRLMRRDNGWIHTLLEEAENERMHLLSFMELRQPGWFFRMNVVVAQGVFSNLYFLAYLLSPRTCHAFIGYLEEEAVHTYTHAIADLRAGKLPEWEKQAAPDIAINYWQLGEGATMLDLLLAVRADEACHSHVNHTLSDLDTSEPNPFTPGHKGAVLP